LYNVEKLFRVSLPAIHTGTDFAQDSPLVAVVGPTASGKSELALRVAKEFQGEIVNCDSLQVYRGFDIGTAKLPESERRGIPHHLIDILAPDEIFTAGEFARQARRVAAEISGRRHLPVLAGGTGFYLRSLIHGLSPGPRRDEGLRERLAAREARRRGSLHRLLGRFDPATSARIHENDVLKTMRALEICLLSRQPASQVLAAERDGLSGYRVLKVGLLPPRAALYERIQVRTERMFEAGLVKEVEGLLASGVAADAKPFESLGYRQAVQVVRGEMSVAEAVDDTALRTRQYAKRQMTWFRKEPGIETAEGFGDDEEIVRRVMERVREFVR
jgi:tRNA dimethylallyltransferase